MPMNNKNAKQVLLPRPKAVFFDWDGTLVDSYRFLHDAHNYTRAQFGMPPFTIEEFGNYFGKPRELLYTQIYGAENIEEAKGYFEGYVYAHHAEKLKPLPGAQDLLETLFAMNIPCGVVTNKKRELVEAEIANYNWQKHFVSVVGAGEAGEDKPSPKPLKLALQHAGLGLQLDDIWFVGDTDNDLACSNGVGTQSILIASDELASPLLSEFRVDLHANNCAALREFLLQYAE